MKKIVLIGPAYPYRGGLAAFNERLVAEFQKEGNESEICTFTLQYPSFLFPGKSQYLNSDAPESITITRRINTCNPFNWIKVGRQLKKQKPDVIIFRYWLPFMAPCFGTIARIIKKNRHTQIISIVDNMIPHEKHFFDNAFSTYFVKGVDGFVGMSEKVINDIKKFKDTPFTAFCYHPLYDNFGEKIPKTEALKQLNLDPEFQYILFFGLIRDYKGLDILLEAFSDERLHAYPVKLLVAGEFYADSESYYRSIKTLSLSDRVIMKGEFIPDNEVRLYFSVAELIVQPYKTATQSGVTQIAYHFEKPMLVTNVGGLPEMVPDGKVGYVVAPDSKEIADALVDFFKSKPDFSKGICEEKQKYQWKNLTGTILELLKKINDHNENTK